MVSGDVFRAPKNPVALCVHLGTGVQILLASGMTLLFAAMGMYACMVVVETARNGCVSLQKQYRCNQYTQSSVYIFSPHVCSHVCSHVYVFTLSPPHLTPYISPRTSHPSHPTPHIPPLTSHPSHLTPHISPHASHPLRVTPYITPPPTTQAFCPLHHVGPC